MTMRHLKIILVVLVALFGLNAGLSNASHPSHGIQATGYVLSLEGTWQAPGTMWRAMNSGAAHVAGFAGIVAAELLMGLLCAFGAWRLWQARRAPADGFNAAKTAALWGCGVGFLLMFGGFLVVGGGYFTMWQSELGRASLDLAFQYAGTFGIVLLFLNMPD